MRLPTIVLIVAAACAIVGTVALLELPLDRGLLVVGALWLITVLVALRYRWR
jgi:hypothetical protein